MRVGTFRDAALRPAGEGEDGPAERTHSGRAGHFFSWSRVGDRWLRASQEEPSGLAVRDETGRLVSTIRPRGGVVAPFALSSDPARIAIVQSSEPGRDRIGVFDTSSGEEVARCAGDIVPSTWALAFSPDGARLAAGGDNRVVHIWDAATGRQLARCQGHTSKVLSLAFRGDGLRLLTTSHDGTIRQWDARTGREVEPPYDRHTTDVSTAAYSPDGLRIASAGFDRTVRLWRATGRQDQVVLHGHSGLVSSLAFTPDGRRLATASYGTPESQGDGTVRFWEVAPAATLPVLAGHTSYVYPVAYSPDGRWIASGGWDHEVRLWDAATGEACATLTHPDIVSVLAFGPDSTWLVGGGYSEEGLIVWDVATAQVLGRIRRAGLRTESLAVDPAGARIAEGNYDPTAGFTMGVWDAATGRKIGTGEGIPFAFSPDGKSLVGRDAVGTGVILWEATDFRPTAHLRGHTGKINALAFRRDGQQLLSASSDRTVRLWDMPTAQCSRVFSGHTDEVFAVAFHPDGRRIASAGRDRAVWLWDPATGLEVARLPGHSSYVWALAFSPDGRTLVSGSGDSTVRLWDTEPVRTRYRAQREAEALRPEADRLIEGLFREKKDAAHVAAAVAADRSLSETRWHAALLALQRQSAVRLMK